MTKQIMKKVSIFAIVFMMAFSMFAVAGVNAQLDATDHSGQGYTPNVQADGSDAVGWGGTAQVATYETSGLGNNDPRSIAANIINIILGFLGILAVVLILFGGFKWMTAAGNEDKVAEAKKLLVAGVVGMIIILAAYALAAFVLDAIFRATTQAA
jgi:hypothetical protein